MVRHLLAVWNEELNTAVGGPGDTLLASFSGVLLVVGGSGISYGLAATEELVRKATEGASAVAVLDLVWCVRYSGELSRTHATGLRMLMCYRLPDPYAPHPHIAPRASASGWTRVPGYCVPYSRGPPSAHMRRV